MGRRGSYDGWFKRSGQKGGDRKMRKDLVRAGGREGGRRYKIYNSILTILVNTARGSTALAGP